MGGDCNKNCGIFNQCGRNLHCIFSRLFVLRLVFVIAFGIGLYYFVSDFVTGLVTPLISNLFSYTSMENWCTVLSYGVPEPCRSADYEQCRTQKLFQAAQAHSLTCSGVREAGGNTLNWGSLLVGILKLLFLAATFMCLLRLWCQEECRRRSRRRDDSPSRSSPSPPRSRSNSRRRPHIRINDNGLPLNNPSGMPIPPNPSKKKNLDLSNGTSMKSKKSKSVSAGDSFPPNIPPPRIPAGWDSEFMGQNASTVQPKMETSTANSQASPSTSES